ncbi:putative exonuclease, partial [Escherichia coli EC1850]
RCSTACG